MGILHRLYAQNAAKVWQTETQLLQATGFVRRPLAVQWLVTGACDLHCPHCYSESGKRLPNELTTDEAKHRLIDQLVHLGKPTLVFAGGELWLRKDIPELIQYTANQGIPWTMHTHGLHIPKHEDTIRKSPPTLAAISLDGVGAHHDNFRGKVGSYEAALRAIKILRESGCKEIVVGTTVTRQNADLLEELFPIVAESGAHSWGLHLFAPEGRGSAHDELFPTPDQLRRVAQFAQLKRRVFHVELCNEWGSARVNDRLYRDQPFLCGAGRLSFVVSATGEVLPCTTTDLSESQGNIRVRTLEDIWTNGFSSFRVNRSANHRRQSLFWPRKKGSAVAPAIIDENECWLQSRNGRSCSKDAFGQEDSPIATPVTDLLRKYSFALAKRPKIASDRAMRVVHTTALLTIFLDACFTPAQHNIPSASSSASASTDLPTSSASAPPPALSVSAPVQPQPAPSVSIPPAETGLPTTLEERVHIHYSQKASRTAYQEIIRALISRRPEQPNWEHLSQIAQYLPGANNKGPISLARQMREHINRRSKNQQDTPEQLLYLLASAEDAPLYDLALAAYLWQRTYALSRTLNTQDAQNRIALYSRLEHYIHVAQALLEAEKIRGPIKYSPWMSKAGPGPGRSDNHPIIEPDFFDEVKRQYPLVSANGWMSKQSVSLKWSPKPSQSPVDANKVAVLITPQKQITIAAGTSFAMNRLDVLRVIESGQLVHQEQGALAVEKNNELSLYTLQSLLPNQVSTGLSRIVEQVGMQSARGVVPTLQNQVIFAHALIRTRLEQKQEDPGRATLEMILGPLDE